MDTQEPIMYYNTNNVYCLKIITDKKARDLIFNNDLELIPDEYKYKFVLEVSLLPGLDIIKNKLDSFNFDNIHGLIYNNIVGGYYDEEKGRDVTIEEILINNFKNDLSFINNLFLEARDLFIESEKENPLNHNNNVSWYVKTFYNPYITFLNILEEEKQY